LLYLALRPFRKFAEFDAADCDFASDERISEMVPLLSRVPVLFPEEGTFGLYIGEEGDDGVSEKVLCFHTAP
jgi:hypothetical protein